MIQYSPIVNLPADTIVYDLTKGQDPRNTPGKFGIGRYGEKRPSMYAADIFRDANGQVRNIHLGLDISGPVGTPIYSFTDGKILMSGYNSADGDYGYTLITEHFVENRPLYALWGHLNKKSFESNFVGKKISSGEVFAWMGDFHENGGWPPHLHFQISTVRPEKCDMPGVCTERDLTNFMRNYPDPRLVLSPGICKLIDAPPLLE